MEKNRIKVHIPSSSIQYKLEMTDEGNKKILKRFKTVELYEISAEIKKDSNTESKLKSYAPQYLSGIKFKPVTKDVIASNPDIALEVKEFNFNETILYYARNNNTLIIFPQSDLLTYQASKFLLSSHTELVEEYELSEISRDDLKEKRKTTTPGFVFKEVNKYYYTDINPTIRFVSECFLGYHMCSFGSKDCKRLSAASDAEGGCARIRDINPCIENYSFIKKGFQTFNTKANCYVVLSCGHFSPCEDRKKISPQKRKALIESLAHFYYEDSPNFETIRQRKSAVRYNP